jgi:TatD DNase family protein
MWDTHCHLDFSEYDTDRTSVLARAREAGITHFINPGCDLVSSRRAVALADYDSEVLAAVGVHPHAANEVTPEALAELERLLALPQVVALGEVGLDYYKSEVPREVQIAALISQLRLAAAVGKPVIIHSREAAADTLETLRTFERVPGVFHCFGGDRAFARQVLERGYYLGFTGICTFPAATELRAVIAETPLERILLETDAPYLAPVPHRGQRCEPAFLASTAAKIAEIKSVSVAEVQRVTTANAKRLFGRGE